MHRILSLQLRSVRQNTLSKVKQLEQARPSPKSPETWAAERSGLNEPSIPAMFKQSRTQRQKDFNLLRTLPKTRDKEYSMDIILFVYVLVSFPFSKFPKKSLKIIRNF